MSEAQSGFFSTIAKFAKTYLTKSYLKKIAPLLLKSIGIKTTGFYVWITTVGLKKAVDFAYPYIVKYSYLWDRKKIDKRNEEELKKNETNGATSDEKVKDELDFVNGNKPKS